MSFFNPVTMSATKQPKLRIRDSLWRQLLNGLRTRGGKVRESGAFLLGNDTGAERIVTGFVLYDDLDPNCLNEGYIRFEGRYYGRLWELCTCNGVSVVADVHTHPFGPGQSHTDRTHPMVSIPGHIALIIPHYGEEPLSVADIGIYVYCGRHRWEKYRGPKATKTLEIQTEETQIP
jgi:hypothetical protein